MNTNKSKVSSGVYRGKQILLPDIDETRPTKSIVKESAINTLRPDIPYTNFIEVFAGSGSVGIEAISNGAKKTYFLEISKQTAKIIKENLTLLGCTEYEIRTGDSFELLNNLTKELNKKDIKTIFYIDPPFNIRQNQENIYQKTYKLIASIPTNITQTIVIEHISSYKFEDTIGEYRKYKKKKFGKTTLSYYKSPANKEVL